MRRLISVEDLCEKCREFPWGPFPYGFPRDPINHHKSLCELRNSAKTGCRTCQIFWLYIETKVKADDDFELKFMWKNTHGSAQIAIEGSSQSSVCGERERLVEDISREFEGQVSMPSQNYTTGERLTIDKFVVHITVDGWRRLFRRRFSRKSNWGRGVLKKMLKGWRLTL